MPYCPHTAGLHSLGDVDAEPICPECGDEAREIRPAPGRRSGFLLECDCGWAADDADLAAPF